MPQPSKTFRVFVSSTFNDLKEERNALQRYVFPRLRELCMQYGCRFQAIDLRWGVREEAALDQQAMKICLEEIRRCQTVTPRPNFIVLLGDRYGWQPVPSEIPADEFDELERNISESAEIAFLHTWYRLDENAAAWEGRPVQGVYILQPRGNEFKDIDEWAAVESHLRKILHLAAAGANLSEEQRSRYSTSATEQEIYDGALSPDLVKPEEHIFCFFRKIVNLEDVENNLDMPESDRSIPATDFVDHIATGGETHPDPRAKRLLNSLKDEKLTRKLPRNIHYYSTEWEGNRITLDHIGGLPDTLEESLLLNELPDPPANLCVDVWRRLSAVILDEVIKLEKEDPLEQEISAHNTFGDDRIRNFTGRTSCFQDIEGYINGPNRHPLVISGESGSGKTALLAKAVSLASQSHRKAAVVARFIGATPSSTDGRSLLESICRQIARAYNADETDIPTEYRELVTTFPKQLSLATAERPLVVFLDALDQLADTDGAQNLVWIPRELPEHVRLIVSTLPGQCLATLEKKIRAAENHMPLMPMSPEEGSELLEAWLHNAGRVLQDDQREEVLAKFAKSGMPLYLKLVFEEAKLWKSYDQRVELSKDIPGVIKDLLKRLCADENHGEVMVSRSLEYLAAARNGLTEDELLDVLSRDDEVFRDFTERAHHTPPEPRLPPVIWSRLYYDLEPYLTERAADGTNLMTFYHNQFAEVVHEEFLKDDVKKKRHESMAQYFDRQLLWLDQGEEKNPNIRKVSELPYQQIHGERWDDLEKTLCDLHFIEAKCAGGMTYELIADYDTALNILPETHEKAQEEAKHKRTLKKYAEDLIAYSSGSIKDLDIIDSHRPWTARQQRTGTEKDTHKLERADRLQAFSNFVISESHALVRFTGMPGLCLQQAYNAARSGPVAVAAEDIIEKKTTVFLLRSPQQRPEFNPHPCSVRTMQQHTSWVTSVCVPLNGGSIVSGGWDQSIRLWNMETGECLFTLERELEEINCLDISPDGRILVSGGWGRVVQVWDMDEQACLFTFEGHTDWINSVSIAPDKSIAVSGSRDRSIRIWDLNKCKEAGDLRGHTGSVQSTYIVPGLHLLISGSQDHTLGVWDLENQVCLRTLTGHTHGVQSVFASPDGRIAVSGSQDCTVRVWDVESGACVKVLNGHSESVESVCITPDGKIAVSGSQDCTVRVWDVESGECIKVLNGHGEGVESVCITADGRTAVSASQDFTLMTWNIATGKDAQTVDKHGAAVESVDITPDGKKAISGGRDWAVKVWGVEEGELLKTLAGHENIVKRVCLSPCGKRGVSGSWDKTLRVWNLSEGENLKAIKGNRFDFEQLNLSLDGKEVLARSLRTWELDSGKCLQKFSSRIMQSSVFETIPDGKSIATGCMDNTIRIWELESGKCLRVLAGHNAEVTCISITQDARFAVSGSKDGTVNVWDLHKGLCLGTCVGHMDEVTGVSIMPDGMTAVSGSWDRSLRVWNLQNRKCIAVFPTTSEVLSLSPIGAGGQFVCGTDYGEVFFLKLKGLETHPRATTPVRFWIYDEQDGHNRWEDDVKVFCGWCGAYFKIPADIFGINGDASGDPDISEELSSCFELPAAVWDDPHLLFNCPECHSPLKCSPFFVDNRDRKGPGN